MLNTKLQSHIQSLVHSKARSGERVATSSTSANSTNVAPCLDDYQVLRKLGVGANATVYLVRERHTSHLYALKAIDKYTASGQRIAFSTVINEQAILTELNGSDFILPLHACFHDTENFYLVTEYLPGGDLEALQESKELDVEAVRFYMAELLLAIEHVHAHNIIHRDLKPENVFIDTDGHLVLGDFGIAWEFQRDSTSDARFTRGRVGTPAFSSPEVLSGDDYGFEADLWAFGVIMYEMLSGREAFRSNTVPSDDPTWLSHWAQHVKCDEPVMLDTPCMTVDAVDLVSKLLRKSPDTRLSDITEIKRHRFFEAIDWSCVASRSMTPPWVPCLTSTRRISVHYEEAVVYSGERYISANDPLPAFAFRVAPSSLSSASTRRQQVFDTLNGCAPHVSWVHGSSCTGPCKETVRRASERQGSLKTFSRWVKRALNRPVRSA
ncbi:kinase-like domain-containing protein [Lactifluus subvellereus]|nr:kinase-like domain-containing protein [Lactifluus subvellereus]